MPRSTAALLTFFWMIVAGNGQTLITDDRWPWEDSFSGNARKGILLAEFGEKNAATLSYSEKDGFVLAAHDPAARTLWKVPFQGVKDAVSAHVWATSRSVNGIVVGRTDDVVTVWGTHVDAATGSPGPTKVIATLEIDLEKQPEFTTASDGSRTMIVLVDDDDNTVFISLDEQLAVDLQTSPLELPEFETPVLLRPLICWSGREWHVISAVVDDGIVVSDAAIGKTTATVRTTTLTVPLVADGDVDDSRIEIISLDTDHHSVVVQERDGSETVALHCFTATIGEDTYDHHSAVLPEQLRPDDAFTTSVGKDGKVIASLERWSVLYRRQVASNEMLSIYTIGDGILCTFQKDGTSWIAPLYREESVDESGVSEMDLFGLAQTKIGSGTDHVVSVVYCEDHDQQIVAQTNDATSGRLMERRPLFKVEHSLYCFLSMWVIQPSERKILGVLDGSLYSFSY